MQETIKNLATAFCGESQARNRYTTYAKIAKKEGYEQIAAVFEETADQETEHAKWLMRMINQLQEDSGAEIELHGGGVPTKVGDTAANLRAAAAGENYEHESMYPEFADKAEAEGLPAVAARLRSIARAEMHHESRYNRLLDKLEKGELFKKGEEVEWVCRKCGYLHTGKSAPEACPSCGHPQAYFQKRCEEY